MILGLVGLATSCARSFALSYSFAFILFFAIIIQAILAILIVFFRYSKPPQPWVQLPSLLVVYLSSS